MANNDAHFSGEGHLIEGVILGDPNKTIIPAVVDSQGRLLVDLSGSVVDIGIVQIEDSTGNPIVATGGAINENLTAVGGAPITEGQKTMANSIPVVIASDQTPIPVSGTITTSPNVNVHDGSGNTIASTGTSLNVDVTNSVTVVQPTGTNLHVVVDGTSPISGTVTANQGTPNSIGNSWPVEITDGTNILGTSAHPVRVDPTGTTTQPISAVSLPLPTGAATSANQTNASQKTQLVDGSGNVIASTTNALNVDVINTIPVTFPADTAPATQNITVVDSGTTTTTGANGQSIFTGTPTAGSAATFSLSSQESVGIQVTGTWTGTLQVESSIDGGTTWSKDGGHQKGVTFNSSSFTANFELETNASTATHIRIRATAAITGTATVKIVASVNSNSVYILNALQLLSGDTTGVKATIKAASTPSVLTDTSLVVTLLPTTPSLQNGLSTTVKAVKSSAAGNLKGYYIYNPNTSVAYVQIFDVATAGGVTLGTTVPVISCGIPSQGAANLSLANGINFANGIQVAATTTATGSSALTTAVDANFWYA